MATGLTRLTFVVTKDMEPLLAKAKKNLFYDRTQSDMIRELVMAGINALDEAKQERPAESERNALESGEATINSIKTRHGLPKIKGEGADVLLKSSIE